MSEEPVDKPFADAAKQVESANEEAVSELKSKVQKAKSDALKKISP